MACLTAYAGGALPHVGDYVRALPPHELLHGHTVHAVNRTDGTLTVACGVTGTWRTLPARQLALISRLSPRQHVNHERNAA